MHDDTAQYFYLTEITRLQIKTQEELMEQKKVFNKVIQIPFKYFKIKKYLKKYSIWKKVFEYFEYRIGNYFKYFKFHTVE